MPESDEIKKKTINVVKLQSKMCEVTTYSVFEKEIQNHPGESVQVPMTMN